jgi:hypothetical protein
MVLVASFASGVLQFADPTGVVEHVVVSVPPMVQPVATLTFGQDGSVQPAPAQLHDAPLMLHLAFLPVIAVEPHELPQPGAHSGGTPTPGEQ